MASPSIVLDGSQPYGVTFTATIGGKGPFICENFLVDRPVNIASDNTQTGAPQRWRATIGFTTATATLQAPPGTTGWPQFGDTLDAITFDTNFGSETWAMMPPPVEQSNDPTVIRKMNVTFRKVLNGIAVVA